MIRFTTTVRIVTRRLWDARNELGEARKQEEWQAHSCFVLAGPRGTVLWLRSCYNTMTLRETSLTGLDQIHWELCFWNLEEQEYTNHYTCGEDYWKENPPHFKASAYLLHNIKIGKHDHMQWDGWKSMGLTVREVQGKNSYQCWSWRHVSGHIFTTQQYNIWYSSYYSMVWVRERTIPTERSPLVDEVTANFCGHRVPRGQRDGSLRPYSRFSRQEPLFFYQAAPQLYSRGWVDPVQYLIGEKIKNGYSSRDSSYYSVQIFLCYRLLYRRADNSRPMSFTVTAREWVYATNFCRENKRERERETSTLHVGETHSVLTTANILPRRLSYCYWGKIVSLRMFTNLASDHWAIAIHRSKSAVRPIWEHGSQNKRTPNSVCSFALV
jgi:hypothetical protein